MKSLFIIRISVSLVVLYILVDIALGYAINTQRTLSILIGTLQGITNI